MRAYVLVKLVPGSELEIMGNLQEMEAILGANIVHGPYDCVVELRREDFVGINDTIFQIRAMKGVVDTLTCLVTHSWIRRSD